MPAKNRQDWIRTVALSGVALLMVVQLAAAQEIPMDVKINYSLAAENYKNQDYEAALPYFRWLMTNAPTVYNGERIFRRSQDTYVQIGLTLEDEAAQEAYLDSALTILRTAPTILKDAEAPFNEQRWAIDFGNFVERYGNLMKGLEDEAVDHWRQAYDLDPASLDPYYVRKIVDDYQRLERVDEATDFMEDAEQHYANNPELITYFDDKRNELFKSPEERIAFLNDELADDPNDIETVRELFEIYGALGMAAQQEEMGAKLLELAPTTETYIQLGDLRANNADYDGALELYASALELAGENAELKRDLEFKMAETNYDKGALQTARTHARRAASHDNSFGEPYFLIGDVLVKAVQDSEFEREDRAVYWLAMDYWERAGSVDPDLRSRARSKVQQYDQYAPTKEDKFFQGWNEGDAYKIDYGRYAWVNETTKVR